MHVLLAVCFQCGFFIVQQRMHSSVFCENGCLIFFFFYFSLLFCKYYQSLFLLIARFG